MEKGTYKLQVSGKGNTKAQAFASALSMIQKEVQKTQEVLLRIEPVNVVVLSAEENTWKEKFLFFFFPRERSEFKVTLEVEVEILTLSLEKVHFKKSRVADPEGFTIPLIQKKI